MSLEFQGYSHLRKCIKTGAIQINNVKPLTETRGIRRYEQALEYLRAIGGVKASPVLVGQGLINFAGKDVGVTLNGMIPEEMKDITTLDQYMVEGSVKNLFSYSEGIIIGAELKKNLSISYGDNLSVAATNGQVRTFKVVGIFRTGRANLDTIQTYLSFKKVQALLNRPNRANSILVKVRDPYNARIISQDIEKKVGYKSVSWQESSEDLMNTLTIRNRIMYTVVSAVLIVAAFGIYNVISTVVMEKYRDIAILKSMGFYSREIRFIFVTQGVILGVMGCVIGLPLGMIFMTLLGQIKFKPPGSSQFIQMPIDWGYQQFLIAGAFALGSALFASYFPSRRAGKIQPVEILRGGAW